MRPLPLLLVSGLLAGCGNLVPTHDTTPPPLRGDFRVTPTTAAAGDAAVDREWDGFFVDPRLRQVVGIALVQNRGVQGGAATVDRLQAQYRVSRAALLPELRAGVGATRQETGGADTRTYSVTLGLAAYEIDLFDRVGSLRGAALSRFLAQEETQRGVRLSLVAEVVNAWLTLAAERQRLALAQELQASQQRSLSLAEALYARGGSSGIERARARTAYEAARGEAARSVTAAQQARLLLEQLAGQPLADGLLPDAQPDQPVSALPQVPGGLPSEVLLQRPDVRSAEQRLQAAAYDVGAARAAQFPRLTLTASAGTRSSELDGLFRAGSGLLSIAPSLDLPIFDAGSRRAQADASEAARREALASYQAALQSAFRDVADALAVRDGLAERLAAQLAQLEAAQQSLRLVELGYRLGRSSQLELLDAQRQLTAAQQSLVTLRLAEQANRVNLLRAIGGRWAAPAG